MKRWLRYKSLLKWVIIVVIFAFLGKMIAENWSEVKGHPFAFQIWSLIGSTLIFALSYFIQFWAWYLITLRLGIAIPFKETLENWFYSQLGKYLPGKVWPFLGRLYLYGAKGKSKKTVTVALYFETATLVMAAGLIFLVSFFSFREVQPVHPEISSAWLIPVFIVAFLFLHPKILQEVLNRILSLLKRDRLSISISYVETLWIVGVCVLSWGVGGIGFYLFVDSFFTVSASYLLILTGALAISSTLGLIALFAPGGLGVREGILVYLLSSIMPGSVAVILSVLTRLWMTFIEIGLIGVVYLMDRLRKGGKKSEYAKT